MNDCSHFSFLACWVQEVSRTSPSFWSPPHQATWYRSQCRELFLGSSPWRERAPRSQGQQGWFYALALASRAEPFGIPGGTTRSGCRLGTGLELFSGFSRWRGWCCPRWLQREVKDALVNVELYGTNYWGHFHLTFVQQYHPPCLLFGKFYSSSKLIVKKRNENEIIRW